MGGRVIGQKHAIKAVAASIKRARVGFRNPNRPIASFIFAGPTGVGKTELTKALTDFMFENKNSFIRLDMSEYMEKHTTAKLIGSPPGYVGYNEGGLLTEAVRKTPYSVVLFDEVEKEHPNRVIRKTTFLVKEKLKSFFRPEFLNRIDEIITFNHLSKKDIWDISDIMIKELVERVKT